jgi:hypothetical protein
VHFLVQRSRLCHRRRHSMYYLPSTISFGLVGDVQPNAGSLPTWSIFLGFPSVSYDNGVCFAVAILIASMRRLKLTIGIFIVDVIEDIELPGPF